MSQQEAVIWGSSLTCQKLSLPGWLGNSVNPNRERVEAKGPISSLLQQSKSRVVRARGKVAEMGLQGQTQRRFKRKTLLFKSSKVSPKFKCQLIDSEADLQANFLYFQKNQSLSDLATELSSQMPYFLNISLCNLQRTKITCKS